MLLRGQIGTQISQWSKGSASKVETLITRQSPPRSKKLNTRPNTPNRPHQWNNGSRKQEAGSQSWSSPRRFIAMLAGRYNARKRSNANSFGWTNWKWNSEGGEWRRASDHTKTCEERCKWYFGSIARQYYSYYRPFVSKAKICWA